MNTHEIDYKIIGDDIQLVEIELDSMERIAQLVVVPVAQVNFNVVDDFRQSRRGNDGFGSTGKH